MTDIEKKAYEAFPDDGCVNSGLFNQQQAERREGYIKCAEEYESLPKIRGWVARDHSGIIKIHECKPYKNENCGIWDNMDTRIIITRSLFQEITWESEPVEVELLIRKV